MDPRAPASSPDAAIRGAGDTPPRKLAVDDPQQDQFDVLEVPCYNWQACGTSSIAAVFIRFPCVRFRRAWNPSDLRYVCHRESSRLLFVAGYLPKASSAPGDSGLLSQAKHDLSSVREARRSAQIPWFAGTGDCLEVQQQASSVACILLDLKPALQILICT